MQAEAAVSIDVIAIRLARQTQRRADSLAAQARREIELARMQNGLDGSNAYFEGLQKKLRAESLKRVAARLIAMHTKKPAVAGIHGRLLKKGS